MTRWLPGRNTFAMKLKVAFAFPRNLDGVGQTVLGKCILTGQHYYNSEQETKPIHVWSLCSYLESALGGALLT